MNDNFYKQLIEELPIGYSYNRIICDDKGHSCDFEFLEINDFFEKLTGLKRQDIVRKRATQVVPNIKSLELDWISLYGEVAINGEKKEVLQFFESSQRWYRVNIYSPEKYYFVTHFIEITNEMIQLSELESLIESSEELLQLDKETVNYAKISQDFLKIYGAKYAAFNLLDENRVSVNTRVITDDKEIVERISSILNFKIEKEKWEYNPEFAEKIKDKTIMRFNSLKELASSAISTTLASSLEEVLEVGEIIIIKISNKSTILGDVILLMERDKKFDKNTLAEVYARQLGMLIIHKRAEDYLLQEKTLTDAIFHSAPGMIYLYDNENKLIRWNKKHEEVTGYTSEELSNMHLWDWYKGDEKSINAVKEGVARARREGFAEAEAELQKKDGTKIPVYFTASALQLYGKRYFAGIGIDIAERKKKEAEIYNLSYYDQLTGLYNRRFYEEELKRLDNARNLPLTIVMGDVNGLKLINDSFGHVMGDMLLKKVAEIMLKGCRPGDIIARLAGDEFVIVLPKTDASEAEQIIRRIADLSLNEKVGSIDISISFGYRTKNNEEEKIEELFKNAEDAMYEKKLFESQSMRGKAIRAIINALHEKNKREEEHSHRVSELCKSMGEALGLCKQENEELKSVGLLHDIGKIAIDENVLNKLGKLTDDELREYGRHSDIGYRMLNTVHDMSDIANYVLYHHENWDGTGYPKGLKEHEIPFVSRIIGLVNAYDEMVHREVYEGEVSEEVVVEELRKNAGIKFDPELVSVFIEKVLGRSSG